MTSRLWVAANVRATFVAGVLALSSGTGDAISTPEPKVVWAVQGEGRGTPAVDGRRVYFLSRRHEVVAIDTKSGVVRWRSRTRAADGHTSGALVLFHRPLVIAGDEGIFAFDAETGAREWSFAPPGDSPGTYLGVAADDGLFAGSTIGWMYALQARSGVVKWRLRVSPDATVYAPVVTDDLVIAGFTSAGTSRVSGLVAVERESGRERWRTAFEPVTGGSFASQFAGGPVDVGDEVVAGDGDGGIRALDQRDGSPIWRIAGGAGRASPPRQEFRALVRAGGVLVAGSLAGWITAYDLTSHVLRWRVRPLPSSVSFGLAADESVVYVPYLSGHLVALDVADGAERWKTSGGIRGFSWVPMPARDRVFAAASAGGFVAFVR